MAKYISALYFNRFSKHIENLQKKTTLEELWNTLCDKYEIEASISISSDAVIKFTLNGKEYKIMRDRDTVVKMSSNGDAREENYDVLIKSALDYILENKLLKIKKRKRD